MPEKDPFADLSRTFFRRYERRFQHAAGDCDVLFDSSREINAKLRPRRRSVRSGSGKSLFRRPRRRRCSAIIGTPQTQTVQDDTALLDGLVELVSAQRQEARTRRDFATSDAIRDRLAELGLVLEDTPGGVRWKRGTPKQRV